MNKGIVALLIILALIVLVSPGIVGRVAEKSVDENIEWAEQESGEITVTPSAFDRGWFSSEGQHRIEVKHGELYDMLLELAAEEGLDQLPVLVIDTHLDHGLIPVSSMTREKGSLLPGLGSAISTMSLEMPNGDIVRIPGTIYSAVGLTGNLDTNFVLEAGSFEKDGTNAAWGATDIRMIMNPSGDVIDYEGVIESARISSTDQDVEFSGMSFVGDQRATQWGVTLSDMKLDLQTISTRMPDGSTMTLGPFNIDASSDIVDDRINADTAATFAGLQAPAMGDASLALDIGFVGLEPNALGDVMKAIEAMQASDADPQTQLATVQQPLQDLLAAGLQMDIRQLDVALPQGTVAARLSATVQETDPDNFAWSSLLLATEGTADISIPKDVMDFAIAMNPQAGMAVGMGFLKLKGDVYELQAEYKKGLMTVNGAPMPLPLPGR